MRKLVVASDCSWRYGHYPNDFKPQIKDLEDYLEAYRKLKGGEVTDSRDSWDEIGRMREQ